jgi:hypothetical protein
MDLALFRYRQQKAQAKHRLDKNGDPIVWKLSFEDWYKIWKDSGHWEQRGVGSGKYCMSRINDIGHYEIGNVVIKTTSENVSEGQLGRKFPQKGRKGPRGPHTQQRKQNISNATKGRVPWNKGMSRLTEKGDLQCV